jgi:HD superfamily phosphohydrolase YqeK
MSVAASTEAPLTSTERDAAAGALPDWAEMGEARREHVARVVDLLEEWADVLTLGEPERTRWRAAGWLHDALRDADPDRLREGLSPGFRELPPLLLHGPAAAERLAGEVHPDVSDAVRWHTVGHPRLGRLGRAVYLADFLEPGREFLASRRSELRARMPHEMDAVLAEVVASRIRHLLDERRPIREETAALWSTLARERE